MLMFVDMGEGVLMKRLLIVLTCTVKNGKWETDTYSAISGYFSSYFWIFILLDTYPAISGLISKT